MSEIKERRFEIRFRDPPGHPDANMPWVAGFEARAPTIGEARLALDFVEKFKREAIFFPSCGWVMQSCERCGIPMITSSSLTNPEPHWSRPVRKGPICGYCEDLQKMATVKRMEMRMGGKVFGITKTELNVRVQLCERLMVFYGELADQLKKYEPTEIDTAFYSETTLYTNACTTGVGCRKRAGHAGACQRACQACGGGYVGRSLEEAANPDEVCEVCHGRGFLNVCRRCRGHGREPDPPTGHLDCIACEGVGGHSFDAESDVEVGDDEN